MGLFGDLAKLRKAGVRQSMNTDYAGSIRESARLAEQYGGMDPNQPFGSHGAASANPFANLQAYQSGIPAAGTVLSLADTGQAIEGVPVYRVELEVRVDGWQPYFSSYQTVISAAALPNWQPGRVLPFRVSQSDPHTLMLG